MYARDRGSPPLLTHVTVRVAVEDENDHAPTFGSAHLSLEVPEGQDPQTLTVLRASDPDVGANGQLQYHILGEKCPTFANLAPLAQIYSLWAYVSLSVSGFPFPFLGLLPFQSCIYVFLSVSFYTSSALYVSLCLCFYFLFLFFFFLVSPCGALVLKLFGLSNP